MLIMQIYVMQLLMQHRSINSIHLSVCTIGISSFPTLSCS